MNPEKHILRYRRMERINQLKKVSGRIAGVACLMAVSASWAFEAASTPKEIDSHLTTIDTGSTPQDTVSEAAALLAQENNLDIEEINDIVPASQDLSSEIIEINGSVQPGTVVEVTLYSEDHIAGPDSYSVSARPVDI